MAILAPTARANHQRHCVWMAMDWPQLKAWIHLRVPSKRVAMVSRKVFCGASSPFLAGIRDGPGDHQDGGPETNSSSHISGLHSCYGLLGYGTETCGQTQRDRACGCETEADRATHHAFYNVHLRYWI
jgi:hypothetical protein